MKQEPNKIPLAGNNLPSVDVSSFGERVAQSSSVEFKIIILL